MIGALSVIIPSFRSRDLTLIAIRSFEEFKPKDLYIRYIVVENSDDTSYKEEILGCAENVIWIDNPTEALGSEANAEAIEIGLRKVNTEWVFLCHCDICVSSNLFFEELYGKIKEGYELIGTVLDPARINAIHISGCLVTEEMADKVSYCPLYSGETQVLDVGDSLTVYCREHDIKHYCFENTFNSPELREKVNDDYRDFKVDRCLNDDGEVMFLHLGRGIPKTQKTYKKAGRVDLKGWVDFCNREVLSGQD